MPKAGRMILVCLFSLSSTLHPNIHLRTAVFILGIADILDVARILEAGITWANCYDELPTSMSFAGFRQTVIRRELGELAGL